jgi:hypothetical protein
MREPAAAEVSVRLSGGLGNQMFQYAAARALALRCVANLVLDASFFDAGRHRRFDLQALPLAPHRLLSAAQGPAARSRAALARVWRNVAGPSIPEYRETHFHFDPAWEGLRAPLHLRGHFQSARYFGGQAAVLRRELMPPTPQDAQSQVFLQMLRQRACAALHVRRGDYLSAKNAAIYVHLDAAYYAAAMLRLPAGTQVLVFSDDIDWCQRALKAPAHLPGLEFVGTQGVPRTALADLHLMAQAQHHVIANSSLSWWGAWLGQQGQGEAGIVVAPARWFVDGAVDTSDLIPEAWQRL